MELEDEITIPYAPRNWAKRFHNSYKRWSVLVLHRRAGKTTALLNNHQRAAIDDEWERIRLKTLLPSLSETEIATLLKRRTYWHVMPSYHQAKLTGAWDTLREISQPIPGVKRNASELSVTYPNGSKLQLIGAADPDALRGPALSGLSLDEYSQIPSNAFDSVLSKALADHLGYCIFSGTIQGHDQLYTRYENAKNNPDWFALWQDIDQSLATEAGATITALREALENDRKMVKDGQMSQAEFDQEWYLSPEAAIKGAFYGEQIKRARDEKRIGAVRYDPALPVDTDWDLGIDAMAIWFSQSDRLGNVRLVDYYEDIGGGLPAAVRAVQQRQQTEGYVYGKHYPPHDIEVRDIGSGKTRRQIASGLGLQFDVTPRLSVEEGIEAAQLLFNRCYFDEVKCKAGILALSHYRRTYNKRTDTYTETPVHDGASHGADAFRGLAVRHKIPTDKRIYTPKPTRPPASYMGA